MQVLVGLVGCGAGCGAGWLGTQLQGLPMEHWQGGGLLGGPQLQEGGFQACRQLQTELHCAVLVKRRNYIWISHSEKSV